MNRRSFLQSVAGVGLGFGACARGRPAGRDSRPNFVFILTDDQRHDAVGYSGNPHVQTPNIDNLAARGMKFSNGFVVLSICSPSRAACLTGRYGSRNGVNFVGAGAKLNEGERTFAHYLKQQGYSTAMVGKWHLEDSPQACGFDWVTHFVSNGPQWNRKVNEQGRQKTAGGFIEDYNADRAITFLNEMERTGGPFVLFLCPQLVHMDHNFDWKPKPETMAKYANADVPLPDTWRDDLEGKPEYLKNDRSRSQALKYGYDKPENIREHFRKYYAAVTDMDAALGRVIDAVRDKGLADKTYFMFMGDNGWFMGEHGFTSKVLAYEKSIRVPFFVAGPDVKAGTSEEIVLNVDWAPTIMELAGLPVPERMQGRSLVPLLRGQQVRWRDGFLYEAPVPCLGTRPLLAVRTHRWKLIRTFETKACEKVVFEELYDLENDPHEIENLAAVQEYEEVKSQMAAVMAAKRSELGI